jgi:hypothetical protein
MVTCTIDTIEHTHQQRYPGQMIHVIDLDDYAYLVPFIESDEEVFLGTIIPSRKASITYLGEKQ